MILVVCLSPTIQKTIEFENLRVGEVNRVPGTRTDASGKGVNSARVLAQLGAEVTHLSHVGGRFASWFVEMAEHDGVRMATVSSAAEIRFCYTLLDRNTRSTTEIVEESPRVTPDVESALLATFQSLARGAAVVLLTGSKAAGFTPAAFPAMIKAAKTAGARVIVDCRGEDLLASLACGPDIIKPNFSEFVSTFFGESIPESHLADATLIHRVKDHMRKLRQEQGIHSVVTRGSHPTLFTPDTPDGIAEHTPEHVHPRSTLGCGDAFGAGLCLAVERSLPMDRAVRIASRAAGFCALTPIPGSIKQPDGTLPAREILSA